jgi:hypothetical protein
MKKVASIFLLTLTLFSCSEEITRNSPSIQGLKDDVLWRAKASQATVDANNRITITGLTAYETLTLTTASKNPGTYVLGLNDVNAAHYIFSKDNLELEYETGAGIGDGEIKITEFDPTNMTISGTFRFNAENVGDNPLGGPILNFQQGVFYKLPVFPEL